MVFAFDLPLAQSFALMADTPDGSTDSASSSPPKGTKTPDGHSRSGSSGASRPPSDNISSTGSAHAPRRTAAPCRSNLFSACAAAGVPIAIGNCRVLPIPVFPAVRSVAWLAVRERAGTVVVLHLAVHIHKDIF